MSSLAVFDTPSIPDGWEGQDVVRIVDPLGTGVAWIDPRLAGLCVGYFARARRADAWVPVLVSAPPSSLDAPGAVGGEFLLAIPGQGATPARAAGSWSLETRDPTSVIAAGTVGEKQVRLSSGFVDGDLVLTAESASGLNGRGCAGFRLSIRDVDIGDCKEGRIDIVSDRLPAGVLRSIGPSTMPARWERPGCAGRVVSLEWLPDASVPGDRPLDGTTVSLTISPR